LLLVPVELYDPILGTFLPFEAVRMLVACPTTSIGVEEKSLLILLGDIVMEVLSEGELTVKLGLLAQPQ
jgi:hypothetical protein